MKILQVNCVYNQGSTGKITHAIHVQLLRNGFQSAVCYGRGMVTTEPNIYKICSEIYAKINKLISKFTGIMYGGCFFSTQKLIHIIKRESPDVVHIQCINGNFVNIYKLISWLKENEIKTVLTLHAEFMYTGGCSYSIDCNQWSTQEGCGYSKCPRWRVVTGSIFANRTRDMWLKMKRAFDGFENNLLIVSVSPWLYERAKQSTILKGFNHLIVLNGLNTDVFCRCEIGNIRKKYYEKSEKIIFHVTPKFDDNPDNIKGGYYLLKLAEKFKDCNVKFLVAGAYPENLCVPENIVLLGKISDQRELAVYYSNADITVLTSRRETFSMIVAESLCCGTPVVGFNAGAPEQIAISEFSCFSEFGNVDLLAENIKAMLDRKIDRDYLASLAHDKYSQSNMYCKYVEIYKRMIK